LLVANIDGLSIVAFNIERTYSSALEPRLTILAAASWKRLQEKSRK